MMSEVREVGTCEHDGRQKMLLQVPYQRMPCQATYQFLGQDLCLKGFQCMTGVSTDFLKTARTCANQGLTTYLERGKGTRQASARDQMIQAIWMVVQDLHHQSPYATTKVDPDKWHIPFHHKVCLWRLVLKLQEDRKTDDVKPAVFSRDPRYHEFRRCILLPEFEDLVFHRMVDIGRCPRCQYMEWKCASVPLELRPAWQDALAKHHHLHIAQKRCYATDRAKASIEFPAIQLYMVHQSKSYKSAG